MGVYWCHNYRWGATNPTNIVLPAKASLPSFSSCNMYHVEPGCIFHMKQNGSKAIKQFTFDSFLAQCGDIESNPGPKREPKPDKAKIMQDKVESHDTKLEELENLVKSQAELIDQLKSKQTAQESAITGVKEDIGEIKRKLTGLDNLGSATSDTSSKVKELQDAIDDINEKVWELDKSWRNNLVFYGIKQEAGGDEHPSITESKIRDVITRRLRITREVPIMRVKRTTNGPEVRGCKPVTVYFEKWQDKDDILRKANMLRGANIYISEDFSKRVRDQRQELQKFMKHMRQRRPNSKFSLQYDKLIVDHEIFMFNDLTGRVEEVGRSGSPGPPEDFNTSGYPPSSHGPGSANLERMRKRSSGRRKVSPGYTGPQQARLQKSFSTDSSLHHMVPSSPIHPPEPGNNRHKDEDYESENGESRHGSPVKSVAKPRMNGSTPLSPSKSVKSMPKVVETEEPPAPITNGHATIETPAIEPANNESGVQIPVAAAE